MQFERDLWRRFGRNTRGNALAHAERIELLDTAALKAETAQAGLAVHQATDRQRCPRLLEYAFMLREIARHAGEINTYAQAVAELEERSDQMHDEGLRDLFRRPLVNTNR